MLFLLRALGMLQLMSLISLAKILGALVLDSAGQVIARMRKVALTPQERRRLKPEISSAKRVPASEL